MTFNYDANGLFSVIYNGATYYYVQNAQGDVIAITNASGTRVVEYTYDAWGNILSTTGSMRLTLGTTQPFRYRGYVYDSELGLYYLQSRYYDPALGRFICADDVANLGADGTLLSYNLYAYCLNNPVNSFDDDGNFALPNWAKVAVGVGVIAGLAVLTTVSGGTVGVIAGAAFSGALSGGFGGAVVGAISGGIANGVAGVIDGLCSGFMSGVLIGGSTSAIVSGLSIASGSIEVIGSAQKTQTFFHRAASIIEAGKMSMNPIKYSKITLNRSLNTAGLSGRRMPDVIGVTRSGTSKLIEVVSKSQTVGQMVNKCISMSSTNPGATFKVVGWAAKISQFIK